MSLYITIGGVNYERKIEHKSIRITQALTKEIDTASFQVYQESGESLDFSVGDEVIFGDITFLVDEFGNNVVDESENKVVEDTEGEKVFAGNITKVTKRVNSVDRVIYDVLCSDYQYVMDRELVVDSYSNQTVDSIIASMQSQFFSDITLNNVDADIVIGSITFNYERPSRCLTQLANALNYDWYIDYDKDLHFFARGATAAPTVVTDINGSYNNNTLLLKNDNRDLKNSIIVRGGEYDGATSSENTYTATGSENQNIVPISRKYSNLVVEKNSVAQTVGIDNANDDADYDVMYNFNEKYIRFTSALSVSDVIDVSGNPKIPVIIQSEDEDSIAQYGKFDFVIVDKNISSKEEARERAVAELNAYRSSLSQGNFTSIVKGWRTGQDVDINSTQLGISNTFTITKINIKFHNNDKFQYKITFADTRAINTLIDFFLSLITNEAKNIKINSGEVIDLIRHAEEDILLEEVAIVNDKESATETVDLNEVTTVQPLDYAIDFVYGDFVPTGTKRSGCYDGAIFA